MFHKLSSPSLYQGIFFGLNSGVITTSGVLTSLAQTTTNPLIIIVTVISLAISDGLGESYGIYISKKAEKPNDKTSGPKLSFIGLLATKFIICLSFLLPLIFTKNLNCYKKIYWQLLWGLFVLFLLDYNLAKHRKENIRKYLMPHIFLMFFVVLSTKFFGQLLNRLHS